MSRPKGIKETKQRKGKHHKCGTRLYDIWRDMRHRCSCPGMRNYKDYGGRGISVCEEWNKDFMTFYDWAIANGYRDDLTIDRIDVDGNYTPDNCRWADKSTQCANKRNQGLCEYIGVSLHSNGSCYATYVRHNNKVVFWYTNRSKNECAKKRNEFIKANNLPYPLNEIKDEYEDYRPNKKEFLYRAIRKDNGEIIEKIGIGNLATELHLSKGFISDCIRCHRNSKIYIFEKEKV